MDHSKTTKPTIVLVHGAFSSPNAFNYIRVSVHDIARFVDFEYDWELPTTINAMKLAAVVNDISGPVIVLGHSLGGNVAILATQHVITPNLVRVITIGSPLGGSKMASVLKIMYPSVQVFRHICTSSPHIVALRQFTPNVPVFSLVTKKDLGPMQYEASDGVVTLKSQMALPYPSYIQLNYGHTEVLLTNETIEILRRLITTPSR